MTNFSAIIIAAWVVFMLGLCWFAICNHRCLKQRIALLYEIRDRCRSKILDISPPPILSDPESAMVHQGLNDWSALLKDVDSVPYNDHVWALVYFRDYRKLYPVRLRRFMGWE